LFVWRLESVRVKQLETTTTYTNNQRVLDKYTATMSNASPERPSRRATSRRKVVLDEEDSSDIESSTISRRQEDSEEEEFTPAPKNSRASPRRRTAASTAATPRASTARRTRASESVEPSQIFSPPQSEAGEPLSPTKKAAPKRRSVKDARAARKSRVSIAPDAPELQPPLPTPQPSESPRPAQHPWQTLRSLR
jgi:structural maintenance of chromosome 4